MRTLTICPHCHNQFDVSGHEAGEKVRCHCGALMTVPARRDEVARVVRCSSCGAARGKNSAVCDFCGSRFTTFDQGWGLMCPSCFCRLPDDAAFCVECGLHLEPQKLEAEHTEILCPRCNVPLRSRHLGGIEVCECGGCGGLWLTNNTFETICKDQQMMVSAAAELRELQHPVQYAAGIEEPVRYLRCPGCSDLMNRRNFAHLSGVIIDVCNHDGVWLDNQELNHIIQFMQSGGMGRAREYEEEERIRQVSASPMPGIWGNAEDVGGVLMQPFNVQSFSQATERTQGVVRTLGWIARLLRD